MDEWFNFSLCDHFNVTNITVILSQPSPSDVSLANK